MNAIFVSLSRRNLLDPTFKPILRSKRYLTFLITRVRRPRRVLNIKRILLLLNLPHKYQIILNFNQLLFKLVDLILSFKCIGPLKNLPCVQLLPNHPQLPLTLLDLILTLLCSLLKNFHLLSPHQLLSFLLTILI